MGRGDSETVDLDFDLQRVAADDLEDLIPPPPPPAPPPPPQPSFFERKRKERQARREARQDELRKLEEERATAEHTRLREIEQEKQRRRELEATLQPEERKLCETCSSDNTDTAATELVRLPTADGEMALALCADHSTKMRGHYEEAKALDPSQIYALQQVFEKARWDYPYQRRDEWQAVIDNLCGGALTVHIEQLHAQWELQRQQAEAKEATLQRWLETLPEEAQAAYNRAKRDSYVSATHYGAGTAQSALRALKADVLKLLEQQYGTPEGLDLKETPETFGDDGDEWDDGDY